MERGSDTFGESGSNLVSARGTADGLVIRLKASADSLSLQAAVRDFLVSRAGFLRGGKIFLEWVDGDQPAGVEGEIRRIMDSEFGLQPGELSGRSRRASASSLEKDLKGRGDDFREEGPLSLFDGIDAVDFEDEPEVEPEPTSSESPLPSAWDEPDTRIIYGTLRSGQRVESDHSVVIFGDVNSGAEIIAGGDIVVLGKLRGVAHAGAYDETGGGRVIVALEMVPTQLRIGTVITRGATENRGGFLGVRSGSRRGPELAKVEGTLIVVEPYRSRLVSLR